MAVRGVWREFAAEIMGTFLLVFFGTGSVYVAVTTGALQGLWQVAIVWGVGIALAIYSLGAISGAHMNPAVTIACAVWRGFPWRKVPGYVFSQLLGGFLAACVLYGLFAGILASYEKDKGIIRGTPGSERSAMVFGEYFPNPGILGADNAAYAKVSEPQAMAAEAVGTALLAFFVFALTDGRNPGKPGGTFAAVMIGLTVSILISVLAPLSQAGFNPARDFAPRVLAYFLGYGHVAIPGPRGGFFTVYILSPIIGAIAGGGVYELVYRRRAAEEKAIEEVAA